MSHRSLSQRYFGAEFAHMLTFASMLTFANLLTGVFLPTQSFGGELQRKRPAVPEQLALSEIGNTDTDDSQLIIRGEGIPTDTPSVDEGTADEEIKIDEADEQATDDAAATVLVNYDLSTLPEPVQRMRELIITAAAKGDIEALRPLLGTGGTRTQLSIGGFEGDPIDFLRETSGDGEGQELLAILLDIFNTGFVHTDPGEETEAYIWPYFAAVQLMRWTTGRKLNCFAS